MENLTVKKVIGGLIILVIVSFVVIFMSGVVMGISESIAK